MDDYRDQTMGSTAKPRSEATLTMVEELLGSVNSTVQELEALVYSQLGHAPPMNTVAASGREQVEQSDRLGNMHDRLFAINHRLNAVHHRISTRLMG